MCVEIINNNTNASMEFKKQPKKLSYSVKKLLRQLFKQKTQSPQDNCVAENLENSQKAASFESLESLENSRNADIEIVGEECANSLESFENAANERLSCELEDFDFADIISTVPVHFVRTTQGTFFWTAAASTDIAVDNDLIEPLYCSTSNQIAVAQFHDRWAQA